MIFHDLTVLATGDIRSRRQHDSKALVRGAVDVFRDLLERHGDSFKERIPVDGIEIVRLQWTSEAPGCGLAAFWDVDGPVTTSALVSGRDAVADREVLSALQKLVMQLLPEGIEPGFDLLSIQERPVIISVPIFRPRLSPALGMIADMETCLAAAFFESINEK